MIGSRQDKQRNRIGREGRCETLRCDRLIGNLDNGVQVGAAVEIHLALALEEKCASESELVSG